MATTTFRGTVAATDGFSGDVTGAVVFPEYTVAGVPAAADNEGAVIYVSNGNAGSPTLARSDGTNWVSMATGSNIAAA